MMLGIESWTLARPELFLAAVTGLLLIYGVVRGEVATPFVSVVTSLALLVTAVLLFVPYREGTAFSSLFIVDRLTTTMKALVLIGSAVAILMSRAYFERVNAWRFEYPLLVALATLGMMLMISANDLMALYVGLELQSLALYVIAAFQRDSLRSTEAGVKYFVLGSVASGMLLFGASLIYGFCGGTAFVQISRALIEGRGGELGVVIGLVFVVAGLAFKVSAVPFHMWTPDVYEGAPTPVTALFAVSAKIAAMSLMISVLMGPFKPLFVQWQQIVVVASVLSMGLGAFAALRQQNFKRLMAYSSIGNVGYVLLGLASGSEKGIQSVVFYLAIYLVMTTGRLRRHPDDEAAQRHGREHLRPVGPGAQRADDGHSRCWSSCSRWPASRRSRASGASSTSSSPPSRPSSTCPAVLGVLASVVASYYYLRIVKVMYFDEPAEAIDRPAFSVNRAVAFVAAILVAAFSLAPQPLSLVAAAAAKGLFP